MMGSSEEIYESLTEEQKQRVQSLKTPEDVLAFAREEGMELTDEQLEGISGGWVADLCWSDRSIS